MRSVLVDPTDSTVTAKIPRAIADRLRAEARAHDRTLSGQVRAVLRQWMAADTTADAKDRAVDRA